MIISSTSLVVHITAGPRTRNSPIPVSGYGYRRSYKLHRGGGGGTLPLEAVPHQTKRGKGVCLSGVSRETRIMRTAKIVKCINKGI